MKHKQILTVSPVKKDSINTTPSIRISGKWLNDISFSAGDKILIEASDSKIVIKKIHFFE